MANSRKLNLTRDQLAEFLTDQQQIRQFELLFATVDELQVITGTDFEYQADTAAATANEALAQIAALAATLELQTRPELGTLSPQNADRVTITGGTINGTTIGGTTPAAGTFTTLTANSTSQFGRGSANYFEFDGAATTKAVEAKALGSDTNIAFVIDSKGTGAIDLAAGSSGVNISNGGTVTAITRTAGGTGYATAPMVLISAPTTAGGVQATATCTITAGIVDTTFTITNAGSGYVEQPTVTFSGGGGSGAAAYARVGAGTVIRSLGATGVQSLDFYTPASLINSIPVFRIRDNVGTGYFMAQNQNASAAFIAQGGTNDNAIISANGAGNVRLTTNGTLQNEQLRVAHTASAVNYIQVTGAATGGRPTISVAGSDTNIDLTLTPKGTGRVNITTSIKPKVSSAANVTSPLAWDSTSFDEYAITALANALTINADANASPADGQRMLFRFKDNGTARALTWTTGSTNSFRVVGVTLPTTTVINKLVYVGCVYNAADSRWDAIAVGQEA